MGHISTKIPIFKFALREDLQDEKQFLPTKAEPKATGWDVRAAMADRKPLVVYPLDYVKIPLGIRGFCPDGWWYEIKPRSSTFAKKSLHALYGTIDEGYEGELVFACQYIIPATRYEWSYPSSSKTYPGVRKWDEYCLNNILEINFGEAIGQIIPIKRQEMEVVEISNTDYNSDVAERQGARGQGGFGSTDKS